MKTTILIALLSVLALTANTSGAVVGPNVPLPTVNLGTAIMMFYKSFISMMPCGDPKLQIPILAPFTLENLPLNFSTANYRLNGSISNIYVTGMNNIEFLKADYDQSSGIISYDIFAPQIQLLAESDFSAWAILAGYPAQMGDFGLLNMKIVDLRAVGSFKLAPNADNFMEMSQFNMNFYFGDMVVNNWNKDWDIAANNFGNEFMRSFTLMYVQQIQVQVNEIYNTLVLPTINDLLKNVTEQQLVSFLINQSAEYNSVNCQA